MKESKKNNMVSRDLAITKYKQEGAQIYKDFENCANYKSVKDITLGATRSVDFYEGRQWIDSKTKLPFEKPVVNIIQNIIDSKEANILSKTLAVNFVIDNDDYSTESVTKFASFQMKEMGQERLNREGTHDCLLKGSLIWGFVWDEDANGQIGIKNGAIRAFNIDIADIAVANPNERDVQKQEWVMWRSRESLKAVKNLCDTLTDEEKDKFLVKDGYTPRYSKDVEQDGEDTIYVYTKFFKQNGEVWYEKATKDILFQKARCLNPNVEEEAIRNKLKESENEYQAGSDDSNDIYKEDAQPLKMFTEINNETTMEEEYKEKFQASLYPIVIDSFIKRDNSIFGLSFVEQLIPMQKIINQLIATNTLSCVKSAIPTIVVKEGALGTQKIDLSKPGQVLIDRSGAGNDGIKVLNTGSIATTQFTLAQEMIAMMKDNARANDVLDDGRGISGSASGYAISQLMTIQEKPVAQWQQVLATCIENEAKILEMYYKLYYTDKEYSATFTDAEIMEQKKMAEKEGASIEGFTKQQTAVFNGQDYINSPFNITVEVGETAKFSELSVTSILETLFLNGTVEKLSPSTLRMWNKLVPDYFFPNSKKHEFDMLLNEREQGQIAQLQAKLEEMQGLLQRAQLQNQAMQQEYSDKVNMYNAKLNQFSAMAKENMRSEGPTQK